MKRDEQVDIIFIIILFKAFHEMLYSMKGKHSKVTKQKFNRLVKVARQYEKDINKWVENSEELEEIYDQFMDLLIEAKKEI